MALGLQSRDKHMVLPRQQSQWQPPSQRLSKPLPSGWVEKSFTSWTLQHFHIHNEIYWGGMQVDTRFIYVLCAVISSGQVLQGICLLAENPDMKADRLFHLWWLYILGLNKGWILEHFRVRVCGVRHSEPVSASLILTRMGIEDVIAIPFYIFGCEPIL